MSTPSITEAAVKNPHALKGFRFNRNGLSAMEGLRAAVAISTVVAISQIFHRPDFMWCGVAAFWTCLVDPGGALKTRIQAISTFVLLASFSCFVAAAAHPYGPEIVLPLAALWIFCGVLGSSFGSAWAQVGSLNTVCFVVASGRPPIDGVWGMPVLFLAGGLWAAFLTLVLWRIHPYLPLRRAVGDAYESLGLLADDLSRLSKEDSYKEEDWTLHALTHRKSSRTSIETARSAVVYTPRLSGLSSREGGRLRLLVELADQIFGQFVALSDLLEAYSEQRAGPLPSDVARSLRRLSAGTTGLAGALTSSGKNRTRRLTRSSSLINAAASASSIDVTAEQSLVKDIRRMLTSISDRLKVVVTMELEDSNASDLPGLVLPPVVDVQKVNYFATLQENLALSSPTFHHALRATVTGTIAVAIVLIYKLHFGYWLAMTTVLVLQPFVSLTWPRAAERVFGSALGGVLAAFAGLLIHSPVERVIVISVLAFITMSVRPINYTLFIFFLTPLFVLVADLGHPGPQAFVFAKYRVFNTLLGSLLALLGGLIFWPNWEIGRFPQELAKAIEASTAYVLSVLKHLDCPLDDTIRTEVKGKRRAAGLASNVAEASLQRLLMEPRAKVLIDTNAATAILAAVRRMGGASAALWLGKGRSSSVEPSIINNEIDWLKAASEHLAEAARSRHAPEALPEITLSSTADNSTDLPVRIARQMQVIHSALEHLFL